MEWIVSGYCRVMDQARTVCLELEDGQRDCDCEYPDCLFAKDCPIGKQLREKEGGEAL